MDIESTLKLTYWFIFTLIYSYYGLKIMKDKKPEFPKDSLLALMLKNIFTLGGYYYYWYITVSRVINLSNSSWKIPKYFMITAVFFTLSLEIFKQLTGGLGIYHLPENQMSILNNIHLYGSLALFLFWAFRIKYGLESPSGNISAIMALIFGCLYLQSEINEGKDGAENNINGINRSEIQASSTGE